MQARFPASKFFFGFRYPRCRSEVLPEAFEAKPVKRFAGGEHLRISFPGRAEPLWHAGHIVKNSGFQDLHSGKHQLATRCRWPSRRVSRQKPANSCVRVDVDRTIPI